MPSLGCVKCLFGIAVAVWLGSQVIEAAPVDASTLMGKVIWGYQGWFGPSPKAVPSYGYRHWSRDGSPITASNAVVDVWPDTTEYNRSSLVPTGGLKYTDGSAATVFSATAPGTGVTGTAVQTHFQWMQEYGIDGVFLQRFVTEIQDFSGAGYEFRNHVTKEVSAAAAATGRAWAVEWDVTGTGNNTARLENTLSNDFATNILPLTKQPGYLHQDGKPVVAVFGFGFVDDSRYPSDVQHSINALRNLQVAYNVYLVGGVPYYWRTGDHDSRPDFQPVYDVFDALSPWAVGRFNSVSSFRSKVTQTLQPDRKATSASGQAYAPVIFPGFSWANLQRDPSDFNSIPRLRGAFFSAIADAYVDVKPDFVFGAMFDEANEGTCIMKMARDKVDTPTDGTWVYANLDPGSGPEIDGDHYLKLAGQLAQKLAQTVGTTP